MIFDWHVVAFSSHMLLLILGIRYCLHLALWLAFSSHMLLIFNLQREHRKNKNLKVHTFKKKTRKSSNFKIHQPSKLVFFKPNFSSLYWGSRQSLWTTLNIWTNSTMSFSILIHWCLIWLGRIRALYMVCVSTVYVFHIFYIVTIGWMNMAYRDSLYDNECYW